MVQQLWKFLSWLYLSQLIAVAVVYFVAAKVGLSLAITTQQVTTIWPPTGIALAVALLGGYRYLPGIAVGAFVANAFTHEPVWVAAAIAVGNTLEAFVGAYFLRRVVTFKPGLDAPRHLVGFVVAAAVVATAISATIGVVSLTWGGLTQWRHFAEVWLTWWVGDALGAMIFGLAIITWWQRANRAWVFRRRLEFGLVLSLVLAVSVVVFTAKANPLAPMPLVAYLIFPVMILVAYRLHQIGVVTATLIITAVAVGAALSGLGPFVNPTAVELNLIYLQLFILMVTTTSLFLAITVASHLRTEESLHDVGRELREANLRVTKMLAGVLEKDNGR